MAHLQYNGARISGQKRSIVSGQSLQLEVWGPYTPSGQYTLVTSDPTAVEVTPGTYVPGKNVQLYKLTAKSFSSHVKIQIVAGELNDPSMGPTTSNLKQPFISCDFAYVAVEDNPSKTPFADYYSEVIPAIAAGLAEYNAKHPSMVVDKAGFLLAQTYTEQSPVVTGFPSKHGNRMFNVQGLVTRVGKKITGTVPGQEEMGVTLRALSQGEGATDATRTMLTSPTFNYDTAARAVSHYLEILEKRYTGAYRVITDRNGTFSQFADALQAGGYATDANYASGLTGNAGLAVKYGMAWLDYELKAIDHDIAVAGKPIESEELKHQRELLVNVQGQLSRFRR